MRRSLITALRNASQRVDYILNDTFTTDRAAGAVNGTQAEPGPGPSWGERVVVDTESKLSLSGGVASFAPRGTPTNGDPGLWYAGVPRMPGRMLVAQVTPSATNKAFDVGFDNNQSGTPASYSILFRGTGAITERLAGNAAAALYTYSATAYPVALIMRATGYFIFVKISGNWTLLWSSATGSTDPVIPCWTNFDSTTTIDYIRIPTTLYLPVPLVSDGFGSAFGTTDGFGHAEGVAGGIGAGGGGLTYTQVGTWASSGGVANASALSSGSAIAYVASGKADVVATVKFTRSGGDGGLMLRFADGNNFVTCRHDGTNVILVKKVAGSNTTVQTTAATYVAGAELRVICEATKFRVYYNGALVGSEQTISDAALQSPANHGLYTTNTGNTFDDLVIRARGSGGEYAALDAF